MRKTVLILIALMLLVFLVGCGEQAAERETTASGVDGTGMEEKETDVKAPVESEGSAFSSIADAFKSRQEMKCTFADRQSGMSFVTYIKGEKIRTEASAEGVEVYSIYAGDMYYSWNTAQEMGMKMDIKELEKLSSEEAEEVEYQEPEEWAAQYEGISFECKKQSVPNSMFNPPSNIEFQDMTEYLKKMQEMACNMCKYMTGQDKIDCEKNC